MSDSARPRIGVLGGSFDPVHLGHLTIARDARERMGLDRVVFMPAAHAPLKEREPGLAAPLRVELLRAALASEPGMEVSTLELERGGTSYTIDTARALRRLHPEAELFWIIGADQAARLADWREIGALAELVEFIVLDRPGVPAPTAGPARLHRLEGHRIEISSSEIRRRILLGLPARHFLPAPVADRIEKDELYRPRMPTKTKKKKTDSATTRLVELLRRALDDKKAEDIVVLDVSAQSSITNFLVIASATSEPHLRALRVELDRVLKEAGTRLVGIDAETGSGWSVIDAFDVMVHLLTPETRDRYRLESLWGDARPVAARKSPARKPRKRAAPTSGR